MKKNSLNELLAAALFMTVIFHGNAALAGTMDQSMGNEAGAIDRYRVDCAAGVGNDTDRLVTRVRNATGGSPLMSVQVYKGSKASNATDAVSGDAEESPAAFVNGGNGAYFVAVDKAGPGAAEYSLQFQCETGEAVATGTSIAILQDQ